MFITLKLFLEKIKQSFSIFVLYAIFFTQTVFSCPNCFMYYCPPITHALYKLKNIPILNILPDLNLTSLYLLNLLFETPLLLINNRKQLMANSKLGYLTLEYFVQNMQRYGSKKLLSYYDSYILHTIGLDTAAQIRKLDQTTSLQSFDIKYLLLEIQKVIDNTSAKDILHICPDIITWIKNIENLKNNLAHEKPNNILYQSQKSLKEFGSSFFKPERDVFNYLIAPIAQKSLINQYPQHINQMLLLLKEVTAIINNLLAEENARIAKPSDLFLKIFTIMGTISPNKNLFKTSPQLQITEFIAIMSILKAIFGILHKKYSSNDNINSLNSTYAKLFSYKIGNSNFKPIANLVQLEGSIDEVKGFKIIKKMTLLAKCLIPYDIQALNNLVPTSKDIPPKDFSKVTLYLSQMAQEIINLSFTVSKIINKNTTKIFSYNIQKNMWQTHNFAKILKKYISNNFEKDSYIYTAWRATMSHVILPFLRTQMNFVFNNHNPLYSDAMFHHIKEILKK